MIGVSIHDAVGVVCPCLNLQYFRQPLAFGVGVVPEVEEETQENQAIEADDVDEDWELVGAILHEEILANMAGHHDKLDLGAEEKKVNFCKFIKLQIKAKKTKGQQSCQANIPAGW